MYPLMKIMIDVPCSLDSSTTVVQAGTCPLKKVELEKRDRQQER